MPAIFKLLLGYEKVGHRVHYVYASSALGHSSWYKAGRVTVYNVRLRPRMPQNYVLRHLLPIKMTWRWTTFYRLMNIALKCRPDAVYALKASHVYEAFLVARLMSVPLVYRAYGTHAAYTYLFERRSLVNIYRTLPMLLSLLAPADQIIITNDGTRGDKVARFLRVPCDRLHFWFNGVDKDVFAQSHDGMACRRRFGLPPDSFLLLSLSQLGGWKRVDRAIRALPSVLDRHREAHLAIAGEGEEKEALVNLADSLGVAQEVTFLGAVNHSDLPLLFSAVDIFLSLQDLTNVGNTLHEARAAGKCIVALNTGATGEVIVDGENGVLLEPGDLGRLPQVICELIEDPDRRRRLGKAARDDAVRSLPTWPERIEREINLVERTCVISPSVSHFSRHGPVF